jgi:hypothetical protein
LTVPPAIAEKKRKAAEALAKWKAKKQKEKSSNRQEEIEEPTTEGDSTPEPSIKVTAYIDVIITQAVPARKKQASSNALQRGPFFFFDNTTFQSFQSLVAKTLPCSPSALSWNKITWKFDTPANSQPKNLADHIGFEAMLSNVVERKKNYVVRILTPPPAKSDTVRYI